MISATLAIQAKEAERILAGSGITVAEAARMAMARLPSESDRETFRERYDRAMLAMEQEWAPRYADDMGRLPRWVPAWFMALPCASVDRAEMERALTEQSKIKRSTIDNRARYLSAIIGYRERHRKSSHIDILSPSQAGRVLRVCECADEKRVIALLIFAGIRPDSESGEIGRLDWSAVGESEIYVPRHVSKTKSDRHIPITSRLRRLIGDHPKSGPVCPSGWRKKWQRIRRDSGIAEMVDVCRHTFGSNYLAAFGEDAAKQAMGHAAGSSTLFRHYRRAVTKAAGERFFR